MIYFFEHRLNMKVTRVVM